MTEKPIDHDARKGGPYEPKGPPTEEVRQRQSKRMKEFNRKTGKVTLQGNRLTRGNVRPNK